MVDLQSEPEPSLFAAGVLTAAAGVAPRYGQPGKAVLGLALALTAIVSTSTTGIVGGGMLIVLGLFLAVFGLARRGRLRPGRLTLGYGLVLLVAASGLVLFPDAVLQLCRVHFF